MVQIDFKSNKVTLNISDIHPAQEYLLKKVIKSSGFRSNSGTIECVKPLIHSLTTLGFKYCLSSVFVRHCTEVIKECRDREKVTLEKVERLERDHGFKLYPFQVDNVTRMCQSRSILNCGEPGTGKTIQSLMTLPGGVDNSPSPGCLVLGPRASLNAWRKEIGSRRPDLTLTSQKGSQSFRWPVQNEVIFLTYDSLLPLKSEAIPDSLDLESFYPKLKEPIYLIADEVHFCKSFKTARTKRFRSLATAVLKKNGNIIGLTGTPLVNKPIEFWCVLQNLGLAKETFGDWDSFAECMGGSKNRYGGWQWNSDLQSPSIHDILSRCVIRNKLEDVFPEMPSKVKDNFYVDLEDTILKNNLDELWEDLRHLSNDEIIDMISNPTFTTFSKVRSKLSDLKIQSAIDLISEYEEYGEPILVVSSYKKPVQTIGKRKGWKCITGDISASERLSIEQEFQDGKLRGLAMTIRSSGVSLNLQNASRMIFIDRDYTVANNMQAEGRIYRIGQTKPCYYHYLLINHPMEYRINEILEEKQAMVDTILEPIKNAPESCKNSKRQLLEEMILAHRT